MQRLRLYLLQFTRWKTGRCAYRHHPLYQVYELLVLHSVHLLVRRLKLWRNRVKMILKRELRLRFYSVCPVLSNGSVVLPVLRTDPNSVSIVRKIGLLHHVRHHE